MSLRVHAGPKNLVRDQLDLGEIDEAQGSRASSYGLPNLESPRSCAKSNDSLNVMARALTSCVPALALWILALAALAQGPSLAHLAYVQNLVAAGFANPRGVAVDLSGNVYVADSSGTGTGTLWKETPAGLSYSQTAVDTGLTNPKLVAVDARGNLYVSDGDTSIVKETPSGGTYTRSTVASNLSYPMGLAIDSSGAVYVADTTDTIYKETPAGTGYSQTTLLSGLQNIQAIAVDRDGVLYVATSNDGYVRSYQFLGSGLTTTLVASGLSFPNGIAVDAVGDVYITEGEGEHRLLEEIPSSGSYDQATISTGITLSYVAFDPSGNAYFSDQTSRTVQKVQLLGTGTNFFTEDVGSTSASQTLVFAFDNGSGTAGVTLGSIAVLTQGVTGLDFSDAGGDTCRDGVTYFPGFLCTVRATFAPTLPGTRYGAVSLYDGTGALIATAFLHGTGVGGQLAFSPATQTTVASGLNAQGIALDAASNLYVADGANSRVIKQTLASGATGQTPVLTTPSPPSGVAVDGAGAVYIAVPGSEEVLKAVPLASGGYAQTVVTTSVPNPQHVAVDGNGNLYVTDPSTGRVLKEGLSAVGFYTQSVVASGFTSPQGVAVDGSGNVYVADGGTGNILKESLSPLGTYTQSIVASGLTGSAIDIAADGLGNLYITQPDSTGILMETPSASGSYTQTTLATTGSVVPIHLAVDPAANLYMADNSAHVLRLDRQDAPSLSFNAAAVGNSSTDSPQVLTLQNIGNVPVLFNVPSSGTNPNITPASFTLEAASSCPLLNPSSSPASLASGASCTELIDFVPKQVGAPLSGSLTLTDNAQPASIVVALSGIGTPGTPLVNMPPVVLPYGSSGSAALLEGTISYNGVAPTGQVSFTIDQLPAIPATCNQANIKSCSATDTYTALGAGAHTVTLAQAADANYLAASASATLTISRITPVVDVSAPLGFVYGTATQSLAARVTFTGPAPPTGAVTFQIDTGSSVGTTCSSSGSLSLVCTAKYPTSNIPVGTHSVIATVASDANYNSAVGTQSLVVTAPAAYQAPTCTLGTAASGAAQNTVIVTPTCTEPQGLPITAAIDWGFATPSSAYALPIATVTSPAYPMLSNPQTYTLTLRATDSAGLTGGATRQVTIQPVLAIPATTTIQINTVLPIPPGSATVARQVTFICSAVSGTINGAVVTNVLPSTYGITCSSPTQTVLAGATSVSVNVTIMTNSSPTLAEIDRDPGHHDYSLLAILLPLPGLFLYSFGRRRTTPRMQILIGLLLLSSCSMLSSCSNGFLPPAPIVTPKGIYNLTIVEQDLTVPEPAGFVQTSLIVPLSLL